MVEAAERRVVPTHNADTSLQERLPALLSSGANRVLLRLT